MEIKQNLPVVVQPSAIVSPHPLSAAINRKLFYEKFNDKESLYEYLDRTNLLPPICDNFILTLNGKEMSFEDSKSCYPINGDMAIVRARVHGGGDSGDSNPIMVIAIIAVMVLSQGAAAAWVGMMTGTSMAVGSAVVLVGGMLLVSALIPMKLPNAFNDPQESPTYSLAGSANRARLHEPMPVVFGTVRMYPDHGARPYTLYSETDQILLQVYNFGLSDLTISDIRIGDTPIGEYEDVTIEESVGATGELLSFPSNVDTQLGGDLVALAGTWIEKTTSVDTVRISFDISGVAFASGGNGIEPTRLTLWAQYRAAGTEDPWLGFFSGSTQKLLVSYTKDPIRKTYSTLVAKGQYDIRIQLGALGELIKYYTACDAYGENCSIQPHYITAPVNTGAFTHILTFDQLKSYQADDSDYSNQKRMSVEILASGQLNGRLDVLNAMVSATIPVWNGSSWADAISSNPAWQFLALARGHHNPITGARIYGAGLDDSAIDIETLKLWGAWCDAKQLECNIVFDQKITVLDMMNTVARCGRGVATWANGKLGVVYDEAGKPATGVFGMPNIVLNTFKVNYITYTQIDEVVVQFVNPDLGWQQDTVRSVVPGVVSPVNSVTLPLPGVTDVIQAGREANLIAAEQFHRRRLMTWESDVEGLTVQRGEVAILSHDVTQWDISGRLISGATNSLLVLDQDVEYGTAAYIGVRYPDGSYYIREVFSFAGPQSAISLITPLPSAPDDDVDNDANDYLYFYGPTATPGKLVKITDIQPLSEDRVRITATDEDPDYYTAESNTYEYLAPGSFLGGIPIIKDLALAEVLVVVGSGFKSQVDVSWNVSDEYGGAFVRAGIVGETKQDLGQTIDTKFSFEWPESTSVEVEVVCYNLAYETSVASRDTATITLYGKMRLPEDVTNFVALQNGAVVVMKWTQVSDVDLAGYDIRYGKAGATTYEDATPLTSVTRGTNVTSADIPPGDWTVFIKAVDTSDNYSLNATSRDIVVVSDRDVIVQEEQSPFELPTTYNFDDSDSVNWGSLVSPSTPIDAANSHSAEIYVKKDAVGRVARFGLIRLHYTGSSAESHDCNFDTETGQVGLGGTGIVSSESLTDFWKFTIEATSTDANNTHAAVHLLPAVGEGSTLSGANHNAASTGDIDMWRPRLLDENNISLIGDGLDLNNEGWVLANATLTPDSGPGPSGISGEIVNFVQHHTGKLVPQSQEADSDDGATIWADDTVFEIFVNNPYQICEYTAPEIDVNFDDDVRVWGSIESELGQGIVDGVADPTLSLDYKLDGGTYDGFEAWSIGNVYARYFKHKLTLDTDLGLAVITSFLPTVDQLEHTLSGTEVLLAAWTTITFEHPFHAAPFVIATAITGGSSSKYATVDNITATSFDVAIFNGSGVLSPGTVNWEARGI